MDNLIITDIYAASEKPIEGVDSRKLHANIQAHGHKDARFVENMPAAVDLLSELAKSGDVVLTLGAGNVYQVGEQLLKRLKAAP